MLRIVRGDATAEEVAALLAVLGTASGPAGQAPVPERSRWAARDALVRRAAASWSLTPGPGAWRASGRSR